MPITKYYEFACDNCGQADYPPARNIADGKAWAVKNGAVITRAGKYYCTPRCYKEAEK